MVYVDRVNHLDEMTIDTEIKREYFSGELSDLEKIQKKIIHQLRETLNIRTSVNLVEPESLPRFEGKAKRVIDKRGDKI
jgi:phenylacetate-CoA ligase